MDVLMPQLGETVSEGKVTIWFKSVGDKIVAGDNLFEIETDKVSMEVPAISAGILAEIRVAAGDIVPVGAVVGIIDAAAVAGAQTAGGVPIDRSPVTSRTGALDPFLEVRTPGRNFGPARLPNGVIVTPVARRLAAEAGIDLSAITGSGPAGRIVKNDIKPAHQTAGGGNATAVEVSFGLSADQVKALYRDAPYEEIPLDGMRRTIARRLVEAKQTIPHFYLSADVELDRLLKLREEANFAAPKDVGGTAGFGLSLNDFFIKALAQALQRVPAANAVWAQDRLLRFKHSDIVVAVAISGGLLTPVIRQAEGKTLTVISAEMKELANRARERRLRPDEYRGGATTISNLGRHGVQEFAAIINPPQATVLAVGAIRRCAVETRDGGVAFVSRMNVTLSCDHRVVDGALGAELLAAFKRLIENPIGLLI
jgi:pyruvate dehydrogenase E2 component (dihydrolipoamide acetyltransferase)